MTRAEYEQKKAELERQLAEISTRLQYLNTATIEEPKWKPKDEDSYYVLTEDGRIIQYIWQNDKFDDWMYLIGNCFETAEEAEKYRTKLKIEAEFKNFVKIRNDEIDWTSNYHIKKYYILYDYSTNKIDIDYTFGIKTAGTIYATNKQILKDAIDTIGVENIKKYVLEVE